MKIKVSGKKNTWLMTNFLGLSVYKKMCQNTNFPIVNQFGQFFPVLDPFTKHCTFPLGYKL